MQPFAYANPATVQEALPLLAAQWGEADLLAGGTDLLNLIKDGLHSPKRVVNLKGIKELAGISKTAGGLRIGALVTMDELAKNAEVLAAAHSLAMAAAGIPSAQIRHMGTAGGDICQRPRCWYFRQGFGILGLKDGKRLIPDGANQYHAIFGGPEALFVSSSSLGPALVSLGAKIKAVSAKGPRDIPAAAFFVAPKGEGSREIALRPDEIVTEILIPAGAGRTATYEVRQREAFDWPLVAASVALHMRGTTVASAKIVLGQVAHKPWDSAEAAQAIAGKTITAETAEAAGQAAVSTAQPLSQNAYKVALARVAVKRALLEAAKLKA